MVSNNNELEEEVNLINFKRITYKTKVTQGKQFKIHKTCLQLDMFVIDVINQDISNNIVQLTTTQITTNRVLKVYQKNSSGNK